MRDGALRCLMTQSVVDNSEEERFTFSMGLDTAKLEYERAGDRLLLLHTEVPETFRGQGVGGLLVDAALTKAREDRLTIVPWCPYTRHWLEQHPQQIGDVAIDFDTPPPQTQRR